VTASRVPWKAFCLGPGPAGLPAPPELWGIAVTAAAAARSSKQEQGSRLAARCLLCAGNEEKWSSSGWVLHWDCQQTSTRPLLQRY